MRSKLFLAAALLAAFRAFQHLLKPHKSSG